MTTPTEAAADLYAQLRPAARGEAIRYVLARTPADLQDEMTAVIEESLAEIQPEPVPTEATIADGASVGVLAINGMVMITCTAAVANSVLSGVTLPNATTGVISNGAPVFLKDAALVDQPNSPGSAVVSNNSLDHVTYTAPVVAP